MSNSSRVLSYLQRIVMFAAIAGLSPDAEVAAEAVRVA